MIIRSKRERNFTIIDNAVINDRRLSLGALGALVWVLSKPDDWTFGRDRLAGLLGVGPKSVSGWIKEWEAAGYLVRVQSRRPKDHPDPKLRGTLETVWTVYDRPQALDHGPKRTVVPPAAMTDHGPIGPVVPPAETGISAGGTTRPSPPVGEGPPYKELSSKDSSNKELLLPSALPGALGQEHELAALRVCELLASFQQMPADEIPPEWLDCAGQLVASHGEDLVAGVIGYSQAGSFWPSLVGSMTDLARLWDRPKGVVSQYRAHQAKQARQASQRAVAQPDSSEDVRDQEDAEKRAAADRLTQQFGPRDQISRVHTCLIPLLPEVEDSVRAELLAEVASGNPF